MIDYSLYDWFDSVDSILTNDSTDLYIYIYIYSIYKHIKLIQLESRVRGPKIPKVFPPIFDFSGVSFFRPFGSKNIFNPCWYIELSTQNPNPILKFTISFTKAPPKTKIRLNKNENVENNRTISNKFKSLFCNLYKWYNSYFVIFGNVVNFVIFVILYILDFWVYSTVKRRRLDETVSTRRLIETLRRDGVIRECSVQLWCETQAQRSSTPSRVV